MKPIEVKVLKTCRRTDAESIQRILDTTEDIETFISHWFMERSGTLSFVPGRDDSTGKVPCLCLIPRIDRVDVAELYYPLADLMRRYPDIRPIDSFITGFDSLGRCIFDDKAFDAFEEKLGYSYHDDLCGLLGPRESLLQIALSYVMTDSGEVQLSQYERPDVMEPGSEPEELNPDAIWSLSLVYQSPKPVRGCTPMFGNFLFVHADSHASC